MSAKSPLHLVKEQFGDKAKLVEAIEKLTGDDLWVSRTNASKGLAHVSNAKLLKLHATFTEVKQKFGTREKLVDAILELEKRTTDAGLKQKLSSWPVPRLFDAYKAASKRKAPTQAGAAGGRAAADKTASKSAPAKTAPTKKAAAKKAAAPAKAAAAKKASKKSTR